MAIAASLYITPTREYLKISSALIDEGINYPARLCANESPVMACNTLIKEFELLNSQNVLTSFEVSREQRDEGERVLCKFECSSEFEEKMIAIFNRAFPDYSYYSELRELRLLTDEQFQEMMMTRSKEQLMALQKEVIMERRALLESKKQLLDEQVLENEKNISELEKYGAEIEGIKGEIQQSEETIALHKVAIEKLLAAIESEKQKIGTNQDAIKRLSSVSRNEGSALQKTKQSLNQDVLDMQKRLEQMRALPIKE